MGDHDHADDLHRQEDRIRDKADEASLGKAVADEMVGEAHDKSPSQAVKDDLKAVGEDVKEAVTRDK